MVEFSAEFPFKRRSAPAAPPAPDNAVLEAPVEPPAEEVAPAAPRKAFVERRKLMRDRIAVAGLVQPDSHKGPPIKATLIDISVAGVRFSAPHPLDIGDKLQIRVEAGPFRWTTRMRVIHCTRTGDSSIIGGAFLRTELLRPWPGAGSN